MHDIKVLEEQWVQYKKNKRKPYYIFTLLSMVIIATAFYTLSTKQTLLQENIKPITQTTKSADNVIIFEPLIDGSIDSLAVESNKTDKAIDKVDNNQELIPTLPVVDKIPMIDTTLPVNNKEKIVKKPMHKRVLKRDAFVDKPHKKMHLNITKSSSSSAYKEVEKRFNQFQDPDDSLFLAKSYYAKKEYKKAEYWALRTNKIDKNIEESWIIFVKSKIKLGQKREAIHILSNYVKQSDSKEAKFLLLKLKR